MSEPRALIVEPDPSTKLLIETRLRAVGFTVIGVDNGQRALYLLQRYPFILLVTDLGLDGLDGIALLQAARALDPGLSVIILTARATLESAVKAINHGAAAYIFKPATNGELEQHAMAALARRSASRHRYPLPPQRIAESAAPVYQPYSDTLTIGPLQIELRRHSATLAGRALQLSSGEFTLLTYLARYEDEVIAIPTIAEAILGYPCSLHEARELIKARIHKLRQKLEADPTAPRLVHCIRGAGYMLSAGSSR